MRAYIDKLYPRSLICDMMTMTSASGATQATQSAEMDVECPDESLGCFVSATKFYRELAFSWSEKDIYWRDKLREIQSRQAFTIRLLRTVPDQVHFGALQLYDEYGSPTVVKRELVFDVDVGDFSRYCGCTQPGLNRACTQCWMHIEGASLLLRYLLVDQLGVPEKHLLWVFSGKKGLHCLVNDPKYTTMELAQRQCVYEFVTRNTVERLAEFAQHMDLRIEDRITDLFVGRAVRGRCMLSNPKFVSHVLALVKSYFPSIHHALDAAWSSRSPTTDEDLSVWRWNTLLKLENEQFGRSRPSLLVILQCYYPRVDKGPLCEKKHLIKLPFSVHRETKNIALPVELSYFTTHQGLPGHSLSLNELMVHHRKTRGGTHDDFSKGCEIFAQWLSCYGRRH